MPDPDQQTLLSEVHVDLAQPEDLPEINRLLEEFHYLGGIKPVGERLYYVARDAKGG